MASFLCRDADSTTLRPDLLARTWDVMTAFIALILLALAGVLAPTAEVRAQGAEAGSFLDPFPQGDRYRVQVWGDQMADGMLEGLVEQLADEPRLQADKKLHPLSGLLRIDADQEAKSIETSLATGAPDIVVIMLGAGDRLLLRRGSRRIGVGSDEWRAEYARRMDLVMRALRKRSVAVFWVGLPVMRRQDASDDAEMMNEIIRGRALANGVRFIDIFASFADGDKTYSSHGPDLAGKIRLLRDPDGVHFTGSGYRKLAYFVERELKRAAAQAWDERMIPLAGGEAEQARVRPAPAVKLAPLAAHGKAAASGGSGPSASPRPAVAGGGDGIKAETTRITLKSVTETGREESVTLEILRPAIPASLVSLLTRRESDEKATHIGDTVMTEIQGGLTVVSSVTPLADTQGERRRGVTDQTTPQHRVLQRGESMPPKPGRADEMPWPRPEPVLDPRLARPLHLEPTAALAQPSAVRSGGAEANGEPPLPRRPTRTRDRGKRQ